MILHEIIVHRVNYRKKERKQTINKGIKEFGIGSGIQAGFGRDKKTSYVILFHFRREIDLTAQILLFMIFIRFKTSEIKRELIQ
jgi:hypothetical protein